MRLVVQAGPGPARWEPGAELGGRTPAPTALPAPSLSPRHAQDAAGCGAGSHPAAIRRAPPGAGGGAHSGRGRQGAGEEPSAAAARQNRGRCNLALFLRSCLGMSVPGQADSGDSVRGGRGGPCRRDCSAEHGEGCRRATGLAACGGPPGSSRAAPAPRPAAPASPPFPQAARLRELALRQREVLGALARGVADRDARILELESAAEEAEAERRWAPGPAGPPA